MPNSGITCDVILEGASTRADGSLSLRLSTPELSADEMVAVFGLRGRELKMLLQPVNNEPITTKEIKGILSTKTQSERIRGVLFCWWKQLGEPGDWETFYRHETEKIIENLKQHLKPE